MNINLSPNDRDRFWNEEEKTSWFQHPNSLRYIIFLIILMGVILGLWYLISPHREGDNKAELPLIKADQTPYKIKAESQGVPSVQHQDKLVYGRIRSDQAEPVVEHILPDPETPSTLKMIDQYVPEDVDIDPEHGEDQKSEEKKIPALKSIGDLLDEFPEEISEGKISSGKVYIQLGSLKNYDMAEAEWGRISKKSADILGKLEPIIQKIDLGEEKGIYYRLRTGPFDTLDQASEACKALKEQKVECVVVQ